MYINTDYSTTVFYVESEPNVAINIFLEENYKQVSELFRARNVYFLYVPYLVKNPNYKGVYLYNRPYHPNALEMSDVGDIYQELIRYFGLKDVGSALVMINNFGRVDRSVGVMRLNEEQPLIQQFELYARKIIRDPAQSNKVSLSEDSNLALADDLFEVESQRLTDEVLFAINSLQEDEGTRIVGEVIDRLQGSMFRQRLSKLHITEDYRILLPLYNLEIEMEPLPKSLYLLFLHYPKGIMFKDLPNYRDELWRIYQELTPFIDYERAKESVNLMTDPTNNSVNEKCSRIRSAFLLHLAEPIAKHYYITGKRATPKQVMLDRSLVRIDYSRKRFR